MNRILSLDLGTASIGWAVRDRDQDPALDSILASGVVIFPEGFGSEKGNQFSFAAARRAKRSIRRQFYRRKLRKYATLKVLLENGMAPLSLKHLREWIKPERGQASQYPLDQRFHQWLRLIPATGPLKATAFANIYQLRAAAIRGELHTFLNQGFSLQELLGRIIYNYAQRRGFKSNAKDKRADADTGKVKKAIKDLSEELQGRHLAEYFETINPFDDNGRIRKRYIGRDMFVAEFEAICNNYPGELAHLRDGLHQALFKVRPLKSQKEKVGPCSFEPTKQRIPLSHPDFELFRLRQYLQNLRIDVPGSGKQPLPQDAQDKLIQRIIQEGGKKSSKKDLESWLARILNADVKLTSQEKGQVPGCPTCTMLYQVLGPQWQLRKLTRIQDRGKNQGKQVSVGYIEIWHFLREVEERLEKFTVDQPIVDYGTRLGLDGDAIAAMEHYEPAAGYASLSLNAINRILPFMQEGHPYHTAVLLAGIKRALGDALWQQRGHDITDDLEGFETSIDLKAASAKVYNDGLESLRTSGVLKDAKSIQERLKFFMGATAWREERARSKDFPQQVVQTIESWLSDARPDPDRAAFKPIPTFQNFVAERVTNELQGDGIMDEATINQRLSMLYHHSAISKWKPAKRIVPEHGDPEKPYLQLETPYTGAIQNPAAMRALHETKKLVNYLLRERIIDEQTTVVVEMARDLNEANLRAAIQEWQRIQEREREEVRRFLVEQMVQHNPSEDLIQRTRLWLEQVALTDGDQQREFLDKQLLGKELKGRKADSIVTNLLLWREQKGICIYSGQPLSPSDILDGNAVQIEHTIPKSLSNDGTMENLTLATSKANADKKNRIPFDLGQGGGAVSDYQTILTRLRPWRERLEDLEEQIKKKTRQVRAKKAAGDESYDKAVKERWLLRFERNYWRGKIARFEIEEVDAGFARRQLVDTQVIVKYAQGWLRTVFKVVRGTKGTLTDELRHIWGLQDDFEKKNRTNHTHHLIDAVVNAFIEPGLYNRLAAYYREQEQGNRDKARYQLPQPWPSFVADIRVLCDRTLVYHVTRDRLHVQTKLKFWDRNGNKRFQQGHGVKASLHKDTALGNVRTWEHKNGETVWKRNPDGSFDRVFATRKDVIDPTTKATARPHFPPMEEYIAARKSEYKAGAAMRVLPVLRLRMKDGKRRRIIDLTEPDLHQLKDNDLNRHFLNELHRLGGLDEIKEEGFFLPVKKVRVAKAVTQPPKVRSYPTAFQSPNRSHKHAICYENEENYAIGVYSNFEGKKELRKYILLSPLDTVRTTANLLFESPINFDGKEYHIEGRGLGPRILRKGVRVLLFVNHPDEIWGNPELQCKRLYTVKGIDDDGIKLYFHSEARPTTDVIRHMNEVVDRQNLAAGVLDKSGKVKESKLSTPKGGDVIDRFIEFPYVKFKASNFNALIEGIDFELSYDGRLTKL